MIPPLVNIPQSIDVLSRTIWGEARSCGAAGMRHVASVVINRVRHGGWWGNNVIAVCIQPNQFSCRNIGDPNRAKLFAVTMADPEFVVAMNIATQAVAGTLPDETMGADSYYALSMAHPPAWAAKSVHTMSDGWHSFYRTVVNAPPGSRPDVRNVSVMTAHSDSPSNPQQTTKNTVQIPSERLASADDLNAHELSSITPTETSS